MRLSPQHGDAVVFQVLRILYECHRQVAKGAVLPPLLNEMTPIPDHDDEPFNAGLVRATHHVFEKWLAMQANQRFGKFSRARCDPLPISSSQDESDLSVRHNVPRGGLRWFVVVDRRQ